MTISFNTKKSNIIDSSWCYLFKSGGGGEEGRGKFPFHKQVDAIFKTLRNVLICYWKFGSAFRILLSPLPVHNHIDPTKLQKV